MSGVMAGDAERARVGLCWNCRWARRVESGRGAVFFLCRRAETDPTYPKYPRLPRVSCAGYEPPDTLPLPRGGGAREPRT